MYLFFFPLPQWCLSQTQRGNRIGRADDGSKFCVQSPIEPGFIKKTQQQSNKKQNKTNKEIPNVKGQKKKNFCYALEMKVHIILPLYAGIIYEYM